MASPKKDAVEKLRAQIDASIADAQSRVAARPSDDLSKLATRCEAHTLGTNTHGWKNPYPADDPRNLLLEYQFAWFHDAARFKGGLWSRQSGKDFSTEGEAAEDCLKRPRTEWMIAAPSERQALDSLEQGKTWASAFDLKVNDYNEAREGGSETLLKSAEIIFSNGSRMRAVPGRPDTVRGRSANILLTEFDFLEQPAQTWRAILPSITNPLRGGQKKVRLITTPNGIGGGMHGIWTKADSAKMKWSRHLVSIYHAVLMGLPVDVAELREAFGDPEGWSQEYECQFLDAAAVLLTYELIAGCESEEATTTVHPDFYASASQRALFCGWDFARKNDLSVPWIAELLGDVLHTREVVEMRGVSTPDQVDFMRGRIQRMHRVAVDYTGGGIGLGDLLVKEFGEWNPKEHKFGKIELVTFTNQIKLELFPPLKVAFEKHQVRVPVNRAIREDLHSMHRVVTAAGNVTYRAPHSPDGHADRCTGLALCRRAASFGISPGAWTAESIKQVRLGGNATGARFTPRIFKPWRRS
jgi:phage FluMu gp28-like protein